MGKSRDFYEILNIPKNSSPEEIRRAYKTLVKIWHPDKHPLSSKPQAEAMFKSIAHAYEVLNGTQGGRTFPDDDSDATIRRTGGGPNRNRSTQSSRPDCGRDPKDGQRAASSPKPSFSSCSGTGWRKPPPLERTLECTLEELFNGCRKEICFDRDVIVNGVVTRKEETQKIKVKPGWKKGTKVTFEGMGDERPGYFPADVIFVIAEKEHPFFKRVGDDLVVKIEIPLANALTGWTFSFRLINGDPMTLTFQEEIIYPGFEKVLKGHGMPLADRKGVRGDLRIKFLIRFPKRLGKEQCAVIREALSGSD
ncbi:hypothetical protein KSP39_PZI017409 [Platanthera zijinensis]|uniref:J domain-containing protein n=1 Tax=Platanthera zijinensis TaxID=2320716 RepID=A0AAP0G0G4_9ASPA